MRHFISPRLLIFLAILLTVEYSLAPLFVAMGGTVNFFYLVVLDYAFFRNWERVPFFAILVGFLLDCLGGHLFGIETVSFGISGFLLYLGTQKLERDNPWVQIVMGFLFIALTEILSFGLGAWLETSGHLSFKLLGDILRTSIYTTLVAPAFFWFTDKWFKRTPVFKQYELF